MNHSQPLTPRNALNKAYLKVKPTREQIECFKVNLTELLDGINENESEEFHKNLVSHFLRNTYYLDRFFINTKEREDLAIYNGKDGKSSAGVIIEAKKPSNKSEMLSKQKLNAKAFHELILYYLRERITCNNLEVKHLIATNIYEWFVFDASVFEKLFAKNKELVRQFTEFEKKRMSGTKTDFFYNEIAAREVEKLVDEIPFTHFDLREIEKILRSNQKDKDTKLVPFFKIFSPEHLLKLSFCNDSNSLDRRFYNELLHIIGLEETKSGGKKVIGRKIEGKRDAGSLIENAITILQYEDHLSNVRRSDYGATKEEQLYNMALELAITWVNRVLFLKLLEGQLAKYHGGSQSFRFLNAKLIPDYDELNVLFFQVLAIKEEARNQRVKEKYAHVPYLNSSLFEPNELESKTIRISNLKDEILPVLSTTVLKNHAGKRVTGGKNALFYLFEFLDAYDFSSEGSEAIQEENKTLINASVLGLIFEKINGYKDGSFFTPGFITMYMCRETIRRAVVEKFNDNWNWNCQTFDELKEDLVHEIRNCEKGRNIVRKEANAIVNSLHICDPAVGSGHFLVSALNELIAIKSELNILTDLQGNPLNNYEIEVANDELSVTDLEGFPFTYRPGNKESQRVQETLFHEKQSLIENSLFGVDINPNSVKICRLRLWIELLKNAYYNAEGVLETLPNIDINIKCGNSLISRYALDANIKKALKRSKWTIDSYRLAVQTYREATSKDEKKEMERLINSIKNDFESEIELSDKRVLKLNKLKGELFSLTNQQGLFEMTLGQKKAFNKKCEELSIQADKLETELEEIKSNQLYNNAFEWRFEFPEVLNDDGDFVGFDVVIGNPPYGVKFHDNEKTFYKNSYSHIHVRTPESFNYFWGLTFRISKRRCFCNFIVPSSFLSQIEYERTRKFILENFDPYLILNLGDEVFDDVATPTSIVGYSKSKENKMISYNDLSGIERSVLPTSLGISNIRINQLSFISNHSYSFVYKSFTSILDKCKNMPLLRNIAEDVATGVSPGLGSAFVVNTKQIEDLNLEDSLLKKLIVGGEINRFYLKPVQNKRIIYCTSNTVLSDYPNIERHLIGYKSKLEQRVETLSGAIAWYVMLRPRRQKLFENPKILIRQTANKIIAAFDQDKWYCLKSGLIIQLPDNSDLHYLYLLGLLNSKLIDFFYHDLTNEDNRIFPEVKPVQLFKLPVYKASQKEQKNIVSLVEKIIQIKSQSPAADTTALEAEIDLVVYKLYQLSWDEVKIIDPDFEMSEAAYEKFEVTN
ncbi:MAG: Eco57I restriction-modification methylase domain-containing protein [Mangrovibacterium sp.]